MSGEFTHPKMGSQNGFDNHGQLSYLRLQQLQLRHVPASGLGVCRHNVDLPRSGFGGLVSVGWFLYLYMFMVVVGKHFTFLIIVI